MLRALRAQQSAAWLESHAFPDDVAALVDEHIHRPRSHVLLLRWWRRAKYRLGRAGGQRCAACAREVLLLRYDRMLARGRSWLVDANQGILHVACPRMGSFDRWYSDDIPPHTHCWELPAPAGVLQMPPPPDGAVLAHGAWRWRNVCLQMVQLRPYGLYNGHVLCDACDYLATRLRVCFERWATAALRTKRQKNAGYTEALL